ncbi:nuclear transcription factor Y subunit C-1-like [Arachis duranensis]|uniref:Nuclear transcription factor Y subunit C-1-like n=1 Tax=Arachis duranensis TaxID=130453 RepID=A0A6P4BD91_ARADU|nr:nuclear transcription factor Y subunit C-1-like [Arachis duranensis]
MGNQNNTQQHQIEIENLWSFQRREVEQAHDFKNGLFPLARVRKMMKVEEDVDRISAEVPVVLAKACDLFIRNVTLQSWHQAQENKRSIIQRQDINSTMDSFRDAYHNIEYFKRLMSAS